MKYSETQIYQVLQQRFGYSSFLAAQKEIILRLLEGNSMLAVMPTGSGKSLCFQLPALIIEGYTLVVSPMISLMKDQVMQLKQLGIVANMHNSLQSPEEQSQVRSDLVSGKLKLLYAAPETLLKQAFLELLDSLPPSLIAIDEAHCISMWGHDFRPEYRQLNSLRQRFPRVVCFALTATAIPKVRKDICSLLSIPPENQVIESFNRPNLLLAVEPKKESFNRILSFLKNHSNESGIIYCMTRKTVDNLTEKLLAEGYAALPYHAGLADVERHRNQEAFINDEIPLMVATIAFGMGINKSNVRFVIHFDLPKSLETYYQEIGRAGRDGLPSTCLLLFSWGDLKVLNKIIYTSDDPKINDSYKQHLDAMINYCEYYGCRRKPLLSWFGEEHLEVNCNMCDNCLADVAEKTDVSEQAKMFLSAIYRAKEAYPVARIIKILRGSKAREVTAAKDDQLSVYGIGKGWSEAQWFALFQALKRETCLAEAYPNFRLVLNSKSWEVLHGETSFSMPASMLSIMLEPLKGEEDASLLELLMELRRTIAHEQKVPPYIVFSDKTLREMAKFYPQSEKALLAISGVGSFKADKYGSLFMELISDYCIPREIAEVCKAAPVRTNPAIKTELISKSQQVAEYVQSGHNLQECMVHFGVQLSTILEHLQRYLEADGWLDSNILNSYCTLGDSDRIRIRACFYELGLDTLSQVYHALGEQISYTDLKLIRLAMLAELKERMNTTSSGS